MVAAERDEPVIDLRGDEAEYYGVQPPSLYGYDAVRPESWRANGRAPSASRRQEQPPKGVTALPRRFRLDSRFPPLQRVVHYGPIDGRAVEVKLTMRRSIQLHSTGIEHSLRELDGRVRDADHLQLLVDAFGLDRTTLGSHVVQRPHTLHGAKREWHKAIVAGNRHGFAIRGEHLVLLEYRSPERDSRQRSFGIAYKRIVIAYRILVDDVERHPRQQFYTGPW